MKNGMIVAPQPEAVEAGAAVLERGGNAIDAAIADVRAGGFGRVPTHLRDAHYPGAKRLGHGKGYVYPHDDPKGVVPQQYLPEDLKDAVYYRPTTHGHEKTIAARLSSLRAIVRSFLTRG